MPTEKEADNQKPNKRQQVVPGVINLESNFSTGHLQDLIRVGKRSLQKKKSLFTRLLDCRIERKYFPGQSVTLCGLRERAGLVGTSGFLFHQESLAGYGSSLLSAGGGAPKILARSPLLDRAWSWMFASRARSRPPGRAAFWALSSCSVGR